MRHPLTDDHDLDQDADGASLPEWAHALTSSRNTSGPGLVALCQELADEDDTPPALRELATRFLSAGLYRVDRPRSRGGDPATSEEAARRCSVGLTRPGGTIHKILTAYADIARMFPGEGGRTAREIEFVANVKTAHKRTSELLADGLLRVVTLDDGTERVRAGGRVLTITPDGLTELARLDVLAKARKDRETAKAQRRAARERKSEAWQAQHPGHAHTTRRR